MQPLKLNRKQHFLPRGGGALGSVVVHQLEADRSGDQQYQQTPHRRKPVAVLKTYGEMSLMVNSFNCSKYFMKQDHNDSK